MKKIKLFRIIILILIILMAIVILKMSNNIKKYKQEIKTHELTISKKQEEINKYMKKIEGMKITMIGGSNMKDNGNVNSCGYIIRTKNDKLIIVDGGRDIDSKFILDYIQKFGNGTVDYWIITHSHSDHVGALVELLNNENIKIENLCYSFNSLEWYEQYDKRGFESESKMISSLENNKIKNKIECKKNKIIQMDNVNCEVLKVANPEIINSDNGNDSSMVFKLIATDVNKSMIFLGDAYTYSSKELLENPEKLKADVVQMAHHGQNGVSKEVYEAIKPEICFFNAPEWLYNNDNGGGYNSGTWQSIEVRSWIQELGAKSIVAFKGDQTIRLTSDNIEIY